MIIMNEACARLTMLSPILARVEQDLIAEWDPEEPPPTIRMANFARALVEDWDMISADTRQEILDTAETLLVLGDELVQVSIATGFLESIVNSILRGSIDRARIEPLIGPESLAYCHEWERFSDNMSANPLPKLADADRSHSQKAQDGARTLEKWLREHPNARPQDRAAAENMLMDLRNALNGK